MAREGRPAVPSPPEFDKLVHERARLMILGLLSVSDSESASFSELKERFDFSSGNLSIQIRTLEEAGYVQTVKTFKNKKPLTTITITLKGKNALRAYLTEMEAYIASIKERE